MATIQVLSKVGGMDKVVAQPPARSFSKFTSWRQNSGVRFYMQYVSSALNPADDPSWQLLFPWSATITLSSTLSLTLTTPHLFWAVWTQEETTTIKTNAEIPSTYQTNSNTTSVNSTGALKLTRALANVGIFLLTTTEMSSLPILMIYDDPMPNPILPPPPIPPPHILRPPCLNRDCLWIWRPPKSLLLVDKQGTLSAITQAMTDRLEQVLNKAWAPSTIETYGTGLAAYHIFCNHAGISEEDRAPAPQEILAVFMATLAGVYAASTISNYVASVQVWHIIHRLPLNGHKQTMDAILWVALVLTPPDVKKAKWPPLLLERILTIKSCLVLSTPIDTTVFACLTSTFWCATCLGEFTIRNRDHFDPQIHIKKSDVSVVTDCFSNSQHIFCIPWIKSSPSVEDVYWVKQNNGADPLDAIENHFLINNTLQNMALFVYRLPNGKYCPLTWKAFTNRINKALKNIGLPSLQGHSIRIGAALEYLL